MNNETADLSVCRFNHLLELPLILLQLITLSFAFEQHAIMIRFPGREEQPPQLPR